jgi:FkbM family methyltransferase
MANAKHFLELYKYLPFGQATAVAVSEGVRALLNPAARSVYGQTGEDMLIGHFVNTAKPDFYVDVGCNDPLFKSNTLSLYLRGWRGLAIDGNPELVNRFRYARPRDSAVCAVISNEERMVEFAISARHELSTVSRDFEQNFMRPGEVKERRSVRTVRLQSILENNSVPSRFGFLSIDCEGHDYEVITSFDLNHYRARLIVIEMHGFSIEQYNDHPIVRYLEQHKYGLAAYAIMNGYFIDRT